LSMISANSYIRRSGQAWKIWLFFILLLTSAVSLVIGFTTSSGDPNRFTFFVLGGTCIGIIAFVWLCISIRCKVCKTRLGWNAVSKASHNDWILRLFKGGKCPVCDSSGT